MKRLRGIAVQTWFPLALSGVLLLGGLSVLFIAGLATSDQWVGHTFLIGHTPRGQWLQPPFGAFTTVTVYTFTGVPAGQHFYLLGSDAGGRDLLGLLARATAPSLVLVAAAIAGRFLVGVTAGVAMAMGVGPVRLLSRGMGRWFSGLPYLAFAILLVQVVGPYGRFNAFVLAMAAVGWRDIVEVTAEQVESVLSKPFTEAAHALGSRGWTYFRRHVVPHLGPALAVELPFQASAVLVLLAELGYLNVYLGQRILAISYSPGVVDYRVPLTPELGALLADARDYILKEQWTGVLVPALAIALLALTFELFGSALRLYTARRRANVFIR